MNFIISIISSSDCYCCENRYIQYVTMTSNKYSLIVCVVLLAGIGGIFAKKNSTFSSLYDKIIKIKTNNSYELLYHNESNNVIPALGYVESAKTLLEEFKAGKIPFNDLNKFDEGLKQYFLTKANDGEIKGIIFGLGLVSALYSWAQQKNNNADLYTFEFDDYSDGTVTLNDVTLYWSPSSNLSEIKPGVSYQGLSPFNTGKVNVTIQSSVLKFTGIAVVDGSKYNFTYNLNRPTPSWFVEISRNPFRCQHAAMKFQYDSEDFTLISLKAPQKDDALVSDTIRKNFQKNLLENYLIEFTFDVRILFTLAVLFGEKEVEFMTASRKEILSTMIESATLYISSKRLDTFDVTPLNCSAEALKRAYKDIKVEGLLNFVKYEVTNSSIFHSFELSESVQFTYPEIEENQTFVSYTIVNRTGEHVRKLNVKKITISTLYTAALVDDHVEVERSKNGNSNGFFVKFEVENHDENDKILIRYIENFIAPAIDGSQRAPLETATYCSRRERNNSVLKFWDSFSQKVNEYWTEVKDWFHQTSEKISSKFRFPVTAEIRRRLAA